MTARKTGSSVRHLANARILGASLVVLVLLGGLWWRAARIKSRPIGVVIVTLDTTRADRLSVYGFMDVKMPALDRLAREGVVFEQAMSVAPLTLPAHCSLFTGLFPPAHGVRDNSDQALAPERTTLAEVLRARGFRTGAFVGSIVLDPDRGLGQGFEQYGGVGNRSPHERGDEHGRQRRADAVITDAIRWLDGVNGSPFFLWTHLYDPHRPYDPPEPFRSAYSDPYIAEIMFADAQIGRLVDALGMRGLLDRTVIVIAGDHGESLGDHEERDHGIFVYESVLHVPLIVRVPRLAPRQVDDVVRLVDVMPTVLDLLGVPPPSTQGVSLVDLMRGQRRQVELEAYAESFYPKRFAWSPLRSLRAGRYKVIDAPRPELYDLERDPFETTNIYQERLQLAKKLTERIDALEQDGRGPQPARGAAPSAEQQERLASLGYVGSRTTEPLPDDRALPDPKDCMGVQRDARCGSVNRLFTRTGGTAPSR
jgi:arylsulfatase A-like enzyme